MFDLKVFYEMFNFENWLIRLSGNVDNSRLI